MHSLFNILQLFTNGGKSVSFYENKKSKVMLNFTVGKILVKSAMLLDSHREIAAKLEREAQVLSAIVYRFI